MKAREGVHTGHKVDQEWGRYSFLICSPAVLLCFREGVEWTLLKVITLDYNKLPGQTKSSSEGSSRGAEERLVRHEFFEKGLLWAEAVSSGDIAEEVLIAMRTLITAAGQEVPVSKKDYPSLLCSFASKVQAAHSESLAARVCWRSRRWRWKSRNSRGSFRLMIRERLLICRMHCLPGRLSWPPRDLSWM